MIKIPLVLVGIFTSALAQIMLKKSNSFYFFKENNFYIYFILGGLFYVVSFVIYAYILKAFSLSKISPVMTIGTMVLVVLAGIIVFKEHLNIKQILGIMLGFVSIILIIN